MPLYLFVLIIYIFTVVWSFITIIYGRRLIAKQLRVVIEEDKDFVEMISNSHKVFRLTLPWAKAYTIRCVLPLYNVISTTKMLFNTNQSTFELYAYLKNLYIDSQERKNENE